MNFKFFLPASGPWKTPCTETLTGAQDWTAQVVPLGAETVPGRDVGLVMLFGPRSLPPVGKTAFEVVICSIRGSAKKGLQNLSCILMRFENCFKSALKVLSNKSIALKRF